MACDLALRLIGRSLPSFAGYPSIAALSINPGIDVMGHDQTPIFVQPALSQINKNDIVNTEIAVERTIAADTCGTCTLYC